MKNVLAFDFGGSGGRAVFSSFDGSKIKLDEIYRFDNEPVLMNGGFYWDTPRLFHEMKNGIAAANRFGEYDSIAVDTWGVDFAMISKSGKLLENSYHYRDKRTDGMVEKVSKSVPHGELYRRTGNQIMNINTLFQLCAAKEQCPEILNIADKILMTPDLFNFLLTGKKYCELTMASTTQMLNPHTKQWDYELLKKLEIPTGILPEIITPGTVVGKLKDEICEELSMESKAVIAVCSHDTQSAAVAVPAKCSDFAYISCGTWSLFGTELKEPVINQTSAHNNLTNETGFGGTTQFLNNIIGLWLIQETRRQFRREGYNYSYAEMEKMARECTPFKCFVDPDAPEFVPPGDIPGRIREFCKKTNQPIPESHGEIIRCIYESLALKYKLTLEKLSACTGKKYGVIHVVGGGAKDSFLCEMTADATLCDVEAGPVEATALGNACVQLMAAGAIKDIEQARQIVANSTEIHVFPKNERAFPKWEEAYKVFMSKIIK